MRCVGRQSIFGNRHLRNRPFGIRGGIGYVVVGGRCLGGCLIRSFNNDLEGALESLEVFSHRGAGPGALRLYQQPLRGPFPLQRQPAPGQAWHGPGGTFKLEGTGRAVLRGRKHSGGLWRMYDRTLKQRPFDPGPSGGPS